MLDFIVCYFCNVYGLAGRPSWIICTGIILGEIVLLRRKNDAGKVGRVSGKIGILVWSGKIGRP